MQASISLSEAEIAQYFELVGQDNCPFLLPALKRKLIAAHQVELASSSKKPELERQIFAAGVLYTECLRQARRNESDPVNQVLMCKNVIFRAEGSREFNFEKLFGWPHWLLKLLYLEVALVFGKFWQGERDMDRNGKAVHVPPFSFLSLRSAVKAKDVRFVENRPELIPVLMDGNDDGRSCFVKVGLSDSTQAILDEAIDQMLHASDISAMADRLVLRVAQSTLYEECMAWAKLKHPL